MLNRTYTLKLWLKYYETLAHEALVAQDLGRYKEYRALTEVLDETIRALQDRDPRVSLGTILDINYNLACIRGNSHEVLAYESVRKLVA